MLILRLGINTRTTEKKNKAISTKTSQNDWSLKKYLIVEYFYTY